MDKYQVRRDDYPAMGRALAEQHYGNIPDSSLAVRYLDPELAQLLDHLVARSRVQIPVGRILPQHKFSQEAQLPADSYWKAGTIAAPAGHAAMAVRNPLVGIFNR